MYGEYLNDHDLSVQALWPLLLQPIIILFSYVAALLFLPIFGQRSSCLNFCCSTASLY
jgi:hypothetical protein